MSAGRTVSEIMFSRRTGRSSEWAPPSIRVGGANCHVIGNLPCESGFAAMLGAFKPSGGIARGDDVASLLEQRGRGDFVTLARLIVSAQLLGFEWQHTFWIPMFQLDAGEYSIKPGPRQVMAELGGRDGWTRARWFASPNSWLHGGTPVDLLDSRLPDVLSAARSERARARP
jgi:hypothetical protein